MTSPKTSPSPAARPTPKAGILRIKPYVAGKSSAGAAKKIIKLASNENPLGPSPNALNAYRDASMRLFRYPDGSARELRHAIASVYKLDAERIICGAGSDELIGLLIHAYAGEGDEVLYSQHGFLMYKIYAEGYGATPVTAPEKNLTADVDALLAKVTARTKIVFIANPNNPTGSFISASELRRLRDDLPSHVILAVDAAYAEYAEEKDYSNGQELVEQTENTVMLRTFSKIYGLSALRLGWAYAPAHIIDVLNRVRSPFNTSTPAMMAGIAAVKDTAYTDMVRNYNKQWLHWMTAELTKLGLHVYPSIANFVLVKFKDAAQSEAANNYLMSQGIIPRDTIAYGLPECLRISIGLEEENRALAAALAEFLKK